MAQNRRQIGEKLRDMRAQVLRLLPDSMDNPELHEELLKLAPIIQKAEKVANGETPDPGVCEQ